MARSSKPSWLRIYPSGNNGSRSCELLTRRSWQNSNTGKQIFPLPIFTQRAQCGKNPAQKNHGQSCFSIPLAGMLTFVFNHGSARCYPGLQPIVLFVNGKVNTQISARSKWWYCGVDMLSMGGKQSEVKGEATSNVAEFCEAERNAPLAERERYHSYNCQCSGSIGTGTAKAASVPFSPPPALCY